MNSTHVNPLLDYIGHKLQQKNPFFVDQYILQAILVLDSNDSWLRINFYHKKKGFGPQVWPMISETKSKWQMQIPVFP